MKVSELTGLALDWAVARALGKQELLPLKEAEVNGRLPYDFDLCFDIHNWEDVLDIMEDRPTRCDCTPIELIDFARKLGFYILHKVKEAPWSTSWALSGPILDKNNFCIDSQNPGDIAAKIYPITDWFYGETILIAAMRCFVSLKLGNEIEIPDDLCQT